MRIYDQDSPERDWEREQEAEARYLRAIHSDLAETGCTPEEIQAEYPRIEAKPVQRASSVQLNLFDEEVGFPRREMRYSVWAFEKDKGVA
jgi:hypothetical protein